MQKLQKFSLSKGSVLFIQDFTFYDGAQSDKLLVILNTPFNITTPYLCCKTTTTKGRYPEKQGCSIEHAVYCLFPKDDWFHDLTWVQFHEFYELLAADLLNACLKKGKASIRGELKLQTITAIINCAKQSKDISQYQLSLIHNSK